MRKLVVIHCSQALRDSLFERVCLTCNCCFFLLYSKSVRRHTQDILEGTTWNDALFLLTFKSIVKQGDIELFPHVSAELSPTYKRKRADSLLKRVDQSMEDAPLKPVPAPIKPEHHIITGTPPKEPPVRRKEHEKWKIILKTEYDKST